MKYFIHTTGCKANQWDSYVISSNLESAGMTRSPMSLADIIIIDACTLTDGAERDIRRFVNQSRRKNEKAKIIIAGCHGQVYPERSFGADLILGQAEKFRITDFLDKKGVFVSERELFSLETCAVDILPINKTRFFLKIQDGCDKFCSYCVVPYARGKPRSRPIKEILETLGELKQKGVKEVVLTGIEIASYRDPASNKDLKNLLALLETSVTPERIRISSIDPLYIDGEFIEIVAGSQKITRSLHVPLQSASDAILEKMGRRYNRAYINDIIANIQNKIRGVGIGMDVIVGFPGEDEEVFEETYRFLESAPIYYLHVFPYAARKGTAAFSMAGGIPESAKKQRVRRFKTLDAEKRLAFYQQFVGTEQVIIPEGKLYKGLYMRGYTDNYMPVYIPYQKNLENKLVMVKIKGIEESLLLGAVNLIAADGQDFKDETKI
ncbi:MAG: tRNA (N(6)-L-threonylcarbamoyladenosine(37)-C(2))-methylthiotransferase MtaB [Proteobacteria bacterium]|nr:tRNA (N(6)-L-threonylcarbamoyladenosine(37)-C(2))-methylthiotransferase MtaB [Pseudomonadota bacterium]